MVSLRVGLSVTSELCGLWAIVIFGFAWLVVVLAVVACVSFCPVRVVCSSEVLGGYDGWFWLGGGLSFTSGLSGLGLVSLLSGSLVGLLSALLGCFVFSVWLGGFVFCWQAVSGGWFGGFGFSTSVLCGKCDTSGFAVVE